ncbi:MAG: HU family DNA-binding protein [Nostocoides sp.]
MNKADVIRALEGPTGSRKRATAALEAFLDLVIREVAAGGKVSLTGFGTFERTDRAPRTGRNPRTGEAVPIDSTSVPRFKAGTLFKEVVEDPSKLPSSALAGGRAPATRRVAG